MVRLSTKFHFRGLNILEFTFLFLTVARGPEHNLLNLFFCSMSSKSFFIHECLLFFLQVVDPLNVLQLRPGGPANLTGTNRMNNYSNSFITSFIWKDTNLQIYPWINVMLI